MLSRHNEVFISPSKDATLRDGRDFRILQVR
jgi:hypothetical protein